MRRKAPADRTQGVGTAAWLGRLPRWEHVTCISCGATTPSGTVESFVSCLSVVEWLWWSSSGASSRKSPGGWDALFTAQTPISTHERRTAGHPSGQNPHRDFERPFLSDGLHMWLHISLPGLTPPLLGWRTSLLAANSYSSFLFLVGMASNLLAMAST